MSSNHQPYEMPPSDYAFIKALPGNDQCIDCGAPSPDWGSPKLGILFCVQCSGTHRALGTHVSFVRSVKMDAWTEKQIALMKAAGGNNECIKFLQNHGIDTDKATIREKYDSDAAELYRQVLIARVEGKPEPLELPHSPKQPSQSKTILQGFGSPPTPNQKQPATITGKGIWTIAVPILVGMLVFWMMKKN